MIIAQVKVLIKLMASLILGYKIIRVAVQNLVSYAFIKQC